MKPVVLPMLHLLGGLQNRYGLVRNVSLLAAAHAQYPFEFVREDFDESRVHVVPVIENPLGATAASQVHVTINEIADNLHVLNFKQRFEVDGIEVAAFLSEIHALVENIGDAAAHASGEISATGAEHQHQPVCHVLAAVVANPLNDRGRPGIADRKTFAGDAVKEGFAAGCTIESHVADQDVLFGSKPRVLRRIDNDATAGKTFPNVVVGVAVERECDSLGKERTEALARRTHEMDANCVVGQPGRAVAPRDFTTQYGPDRAMHIAYRQIDFDISQAEQSIQRVLD